MSGRKTLAQRVAIPCESALGIPNCQICAITLWFMRSRDGVVLGVHGRISGCSLGEEEGVDQRADDERPCCWSGIPRRRTYSSYSSEL